MVPISLQIQLLKAKETAEAARHAKSEMLANLSREVHTAMHGIIGMTDLMLASELKPEQRAELSVVKDSATLLLNIVDDALDYFKTGDL